MSAAEPLVARAPPRRRRRSASFFAQLFALVLLSLVGSWAVNVGIIYLVPPPPPEFFRVSELAAALRAPGTPLAARNGRLITAAVLPALNAPRNLRPSAMGGVLQAELGAKLGAPTGRVRLLLLDSYRGPVSRSVRTYQRQLAPEASDLQSDHWVVAPLEAAYRLPDGRWSVVRQEETALFSTWSQRVALWFSVSCVIMAPLAYLFSRRFSRPIVEFAAAAERLGRDPGAAPLVAPRGPAEVDAAAAAFNEMRERLRRYVQDRTAMVGAIAHDLRTPLTRLRFRVEQVPAPLAAKMTGDIEQMEQMISDTLAFVRDATHQGERRRLELSSLVATVADEMADTGLDVSSDAPAPVVVYGDALALRRLVTNLLDNAVKFGTRARARVYAQNGAAVVEVDDDGPGVPADQRERVFEPFHRGEPSRSRATGGAGLGLAVVRTIARAHGGEAELENRPDGGLRARARLPLHLSAA